MLEIFESRLERLGGTSALLPVRSVLSGEGPVGQCPGWQGVADSATGDGIMLVAVSPEHERDGFLPNCTTVLWDIAASTAPRRGARTTTPWICTPRRGSSPRGGVQPGPAPQ